MEHGVSQPPLFTLHLAESAPKRYEFDLLTLFSQPNKQRLRTLQQAGIPYVIYSGAHVAAMLPDGERPIGDMDVMISPQDYDEVCNLLSGGQAYGIQPFQFADEEPLMATFLMIGSMEVKAASDHTPGNGNFTLTDLVFQHRVLLEQYDPATKEPFRIAFAHPMETILFKAALWRQKDQRDIDKLLATGIMLNTQTDQEYLCQRIIETGVGDHVIDRLIQKGILLLNEDHILKAGDELTEFLRIFHSQQIRRLLSTPPLEGDMLCG